MAMNGNKQNENDRVLSTLLVDLNVGEYLDSKVVRLQKGSTLRFRCAQGALGRQVRLLIPGFDVDYEFPELKKFVDLDRNYDLICDKFGSFKYEFFVENTSEASGYGYFSVVPDWTVPKSSKKISLNSLSVCTHLTKLLGPLSEWKDRLQVAKESGYNAVHLTPVQQLGISNSSYSIADFHALNSTLGKGVTFDDLDKFVKFMENEWSMLTVHDVVWNHAARNAPWLREHPECTHNCLNSPHLRPAFVVDQALRLFSDEIASSEWDKRGVPPMLSESVHVDSLRNVLLTDVLPKLRLHEFLQIDTDRVVEEFKQKSGCKSSQGDSEVHVVQDPEWRRFGSSIDFEAAIRKFCGSNGCNGQNNDAAAENLRNHLNWLNQQKYEESMDITYAIVNATLGHVHYERVDGNGPRLPIIDSVHPLTTNYFVCDYDFKTWEEAEKFAYDSEKGKYAMACNGWVMDNDPMKNFAESHSRVYFRRELVAWGDSIKLNYGRSPDDCPYLWNYMREYSETCARIFHGFRIDNCHSTPIHVAEYFLKAARKIRPALYVVAELFTGSEDLDHIFVNRLGITSLIREAQNAPDSHEQGRFVHRFGGDPVGAFRSKTVRPAPFSVAHALFYDQTHDNPSPAQKRTIYDYVPTAAMVSASYCAAASSRGYDELIPFHIHVVHEERLYRKWSQIAENKQYEGMIRARAHFNKLHIDLCDQGFTEIFVDQYNVDIVAITRHNPTTHESVLIISHCAFGPFKWQPDGCDHKGIPVADNISKILFEVKTVEHGNQQNGVAEDKDTLTGMQNLHVEVYENVSLDKSLSIEIVNNVVMFKNFPSGSVIALKIDPRPETTESCNAIDKLVADDSNLKSELRKVFGSLTIDQFNYLLFRAEKEEEVENGQQAYDVPGYGKFVYCGLKGVEPIIRKIHGHNDLGHPVCGNLRGGSWLPDYLIGRIRRAPELSTVADLLESSFKPLEKMPHFLRPCYFEQIFSYIYNVAESVLLEKLGSAADLPYNVTIVRSLGLASISFLSSIRDALLPPIDEQKTHGKHPPSLAAGLPHFAVGIWRNWGRDTFISLPGVLLTNARFEEARDIILAYAGTLRHGLIPNLLAEGKCARYNCRDAVWFWLASIMKYIEKSDDGVKILDANVIRLYPTDDAGYTLEVKEPLRDTIYEALNRHFAGIHFRERNAGHMIDEHMRDEGFNVDAFICRETGLVFGGNSLNCGTWMDKMGSSERANNRGLPSSPRDGAAVELQGLALFVAESLAKLNKDGHFKYDGLHDEKENCKWKWSEWAQKIRQNFAPKFYVDDNCNDEFVNRKGIIKDSFGSTHRYTDFQLRPNFCIALKLVPDILPLEKAWRALDIASRVLKAPLGICTLDPEDYNYNGDYDNDNDGYDQKIAKGWNYHQGPEWLWVAAEYLSARLRVGYAIRHQNPSAWKEAVDEVKDRVQRFAKHMVDDSVWSSLPELTNRNGSYCPPSCQSQAWSVGFDEPLSHLTVKNGFMLLGLQSRKLQHIHIQTARKTPLKLSLAENDRIAHLHLDPRGMHAIISTALGKNFYLNMKMIAMKALRMSKDYVITSVGWNNKLVSNNETGFIVFGTSNGHLYETNIKSNGELKYMKLLTAMFGEKRELPISDLLMSPCSQDEKNWMVIICLPGKLYCPVGTLNEQALNPQSSQPIVDTFSSKIYSEQTQAALQNVVCRKNLQKFRSMNVEDASGPNSFCVFPAHSDDCEIPSKFCWLSTAGIKFGKFESGRDEGFDMLSEEWQMDHKLVEGSYRYPVGATLSQHHALLLFTDRFVAISLLTHKVVFEDIYKSETKTIGLTRDPSSQCVWIFSENMIINYRPDNEARDVWRSLVERQEFAEARKITRLMPDQNPYQLVIKKEAEKFFNKHEYCSAAEILAESVEPFENIVLKFLKVSSKESRNGLKRFLDLKLTSVQNLNRVQRDILVIWLFEIQLSELAELRRQVLHKKVDLTSESKNGNVDHSSQLERLQKELEIFLHRSSVLDCVRDNRTAIYRLITTHADFNTQLYLADKLKDYDVVIKIYLLQGDYKNALKTATSHSNSLIFYKYAKDFFEHAPMEFVKSLIEIGNALKPGVIIISMTDCTSDSEKLNAVFLYLEDAIERNYADQQTHDFLIKLYAETKPSILLEHLKKFGNHKQTVPYNVSRALRVCSEKNLKECCVFLYCLDGMYETAVKMALTISVDLAKECAMELNKTSLSGDDFLMQDLESSTSTKLTIETRKHIWLQIAKYLIQHKYDVSECMKLLKDSDDTIRIQDILGFFPEFTKINHFKQPLCACLKEHSDKIKKEQHLLNSLSGMERSVLSEVLVNTGNEKVEAEVKLDVIKRKVNELIAKECPYCGHNRLNSLNATLLISEAEYKKAENEWDA
ncbi:Glycogen debrancher [Aphelenchoides besseyi]|nr:Glycogen debrancher [Aphelenchoides besseyi]